MRSSGRSRCSPFGPIRPPISARLSPSVCAGSALVYETVLTAFLMFVIMAVATDTRAVGAGGGDRNRRDGRTRCLFGGPVTGRIDEPGSVLRPRARSGEWHDFWIYLIGPILGAALGALAYQLVRGEHPSQPGGSRRLMAHVLFVCLHNAGRSQMSQALFERAADGIATRRIRLARRRLSMSTPRSSR